jgi:hypothetical protein
MRVTITLEDDDLDGLPSILGPTSDSGRIFKALALAGAREIIDQATGKAIPTTIAELRVYRIYSLFRAGLGVTEAEIVVTALFKVPQATARKYIDTTIAHYDVELSQLVGDAAKNLLDSEQLSVWSAGKWEVTMPCEAVRKWLDDQARAANQTNPSRSDRAGVWLYPHNTYNYLREHVGLAPLGKPK